MRYWIRSFCRRSCLGAVSLIALPLAAAEAVPRTQPDGGDTAWMLISTVLVTLMVVPGVALFYAGLVRRKNALSTCAMVLASAAFVTMVWFAVGYSLTFTEGNGLIGSTRQFMLDNLSLKHFTAHPMAPTIPEAVFVLFQLAFAMVTVALIFGAVVERIRFRAAMIFAVVWTLLVYAPVAHWVWHPSGWLHRIGHMDYAGGTVVHLASGTAGLVLAAMVGSRRGYGREPMAPHNLMLTLIGAGLLWVGWFGFNGGSAMEVSSSAAMAVLTTQLAAGAAMVTWIVCEWCTREHVSLLGIASGLVVGLICITPASGHVSVGAAVAIGMLGSVCCFVTVTMLKSYLRFDDSLDVFGLHGVGGFVGTVLTGCFQTRNDGLAQTSVQLLGATAVMGYVVVVTWAIAWLIRTFVGLRVDTEAEIDGLDRRQHGESLAA